jgi:hypothetical protein
VKRLGHDLLRPTKELFRHWSRCSDGTVTREQFVETMQPIRREVDALLLRGEFSGNTRLVGMCESLYDHRDWLWTFVDVEGVEPTNNASERALRHAVIWRKLSFGTQSARGSRFSCSGRRLLYSLDRRAVQNVVLYGPVENSFDRSNGVVSCAVVDGPFLPRPPLSIYTAVDVIRFTPTYSPSRRDEVKNVA